MIHSIYLSEENMNQLQYEVVSTEMKVHLTRLLEKDQRFVDHELLYKNKMVNRSRSLAGETIYVLTAGDYGEYEDYDFIWHNGEYELIFRRLDTLNFIEFLGELLDEDWYSVEQLNEILEREGAAFRFSLKHGNIKVEVLPIAELIDSPHESEHPNITVLVARMDSALENEDFAGVLHASASIFETLAKEIVGLPSVGNQTLKAFFERYKKDSYLPGELQNKIIKIYEMRNKTPLAGHGSTEEPQIDNTQAITLSEMTKAFIKIEYKLRR